MGFIVYSLSVVLAFVAYVTFDMYKTHSMGSIFDDHPQSDLTSCTRVPEIKGCEDLFIHHNSGYAIAGCPEDYTLNKNYMSLGYAPRTKLVLSTESHFIAYNLKTKEALKLITKGFPEGTEFAVHGMDFLQDPEDSDVLHIYSVNHRSEAIDTVEHFRHRLGTKEIEYVETIQSKCLELINAIAMVTPGTFYYTQSISHASGPLNYLEFNGILEGGKIMYYGGKDGCRELSRGYKGANGITLSPDRQLLYVAETNRGKLHIFDHDGRPNIALRHTVPLKFLPDNIMVEPTTGHIYIAGFSTDLREMAKLVQYDGETNLATCKSVVARVVNGTKEGEVGTYRMEPILIDHGDTLFSTTVAAGDETYGAVLLSGLFTGRGMLDCRLPALSP